MHANSPEWQEQQPLTRLATERTTPRDGIHKVCIARCQIPERFQQTGRGREKHGCLRSALTPFLPLLVSLLDRWSRERERTSFKLASHSGQIPSPFCRDAEFRAYQNSRPAREGRGEWVNLQMQNLCSLLCKTPSDCTGPEKMLVLGLARFVPLVLPGSC